MKKYLFLLFSFLLLTIPQFSKAEESKAKGLEISGFVDAVSGWQHDDHNAYGNPIGGQLGWFRGTTSPGRDTFNTYLDVVEIDLDKSFGENIRLRVDLDFGRALSGTGRTTDSGGTGTSNFEVEQAYMTANLKGAEFLIGRFTVPIGYYVWHRIDNPSISFSTIFNYITPANDTGAKIFYAFKEHFDFHIYVVNSLADSAPFGVLAPGATSGTKGNSISGTTANPGGLTNGAYSAIPSYGSRFGFNWGSDATKSTVGISYAGGPERYGCNEATTGITSCNRHLTHIVDLDYAVKFTPKLLFAGEAVFRQDNSDVPGIQNDRSWGGFVLLNYDFSDAWRMFFRGGFLQDQTGFYTGANENIIDFALGAGYQITDKAKLKVEYSPMIFDSRVPGVKTSISNGFAMEFGYYF